MSTYYLDLYMKKLLTLTLCIAGSLFLAIYFYLANESKNYPDEKFLKVIYFSQIEKDNKEAEQKFGPMLNQNAKVEIKSFTLKNCSQNEKKITCLVKASVKTPKQNNVDKTIEFYAKPQGESFVLIGQKYL